MARTMIPTNEIALRGGNREPLATTKSLLLTSSSISVENTGPFP